MRRMVMLLCVCGAAWAQKPAFEVASIHPAGAPNAASPEGSARESIHVSPGMVTMNFISLASCIRWAYRLGDPQLSGPDWIRQDRFQIVAKTNEATGEDQLRAMMQALLAERFKLETHRESKSRTAFTLVVAKGGPKLAADSGDARPDVKGRLKWVATGYSMADLATFLADNTDSPVVDQTGLAGRYDFTIDLSPYFSIDTPMRRDEAAQTLAAAFQSALQAQLGLRLESRKVPVEVLVIDHAEKPSEN